MICICTLLTKLTKLCDKKMYRGAWWYDFDVSFSVSAYLFMVSLCIFVHIFHFCYILRILMSVVQHFFSAFVAFYLPKTNHCPLILCVNWWISEKKNLHYSDTAMIMSFLSRHKVHILTILTSCQLLFFGSISHCQKFIHKMVTILVSHSKSSSVINPDQILPEFLLNWFHLFLIYIPVEPIDYWLFLQS